jgi:hypothetical protein
MLPILCLFDKKKVVKYNIFMATYKELQEQAKDLGLKYVGVSKEDLEKSIEGAQQDKGESSLSTSENKEEKPDAVVYQGKHKIRTYTFENHGPDYKKLAAQFVSHPDREGCRVEMETVYSRTTCPHCHKKFRV